jgi:hypothetical protein
VSNNPRLLHWYYNSSNIIIDSIFFPLNNRNNDRNDAQIYIFLSSTTYNFVLSQPKLAHVHKCEMGQNNSKKNRTVDLLHYMVVFFLLSIQSVSSVAGGAVKYAFGMTCPNVTNNFCDNDSNKQQQQHKSATSYQLHRNSH